MEQAVIRAFVEFHYKDPAKVAAMWIVATVEAIFAEVRSKS